MASSSQNRKGMSKSKRREIRRRQEEKGRRSRRQLYQTVYLLPEPIRQFFAFFSPSFTKPTLCRFTLLAIVAILTCGSRTVSNLLRLLSCLVCCSPSAYHRVFSSRRWSPWNLGRTFAGLLFAIFARDGIIRLAADDADRAAHERNQMMDPYCTRFSR